MANKNKRVMVNIKEDLYEAIKETAETYDVSLSSIINLLINVGLKYGVSKLDSLGKEQ